ncbi:MAG TPA: gliding motility protein GldM [Bacteroidales bacterium]|nr:gliding motility protein GldM [Bacteroidales bacterium]
MGATNCPETPRQKMIQMMYLVLTAMLALNVSKEILNAYLIVNESMVTTNSNFSKKVESTYSQFAKQKEINEAKVLPYYKKAEQAKKMSADLVAYIEQMKLEVMAGESRTSIEECKTADFKSLKGLDKWSESTRYFIGRSETGQGAKATELRLKLEEYKKNMMELIDPKYRSGMNIGLDFKGPYHSSNGREQTWEMHNFYNTIMAADIVILNKMIAEVKNAEFDVVSQLLASVSLEDFKFDKIGAKVVAKSNYILTGETFEADIFVAAYDTKQTPVIIVGGGVDTNTLVVSGAQQTVEGVAGVGKLKLAAGGPGVKQFGGVIKVKGADGIEKSYPFNSEYVVGTPSATISPTKMNVFYIGLDNPVSISVPGASNEQVTATITGGGGTITKTGGGLYNVKVSQQGEATVNVSAKMGTTSRSMGSMKFRCKRVPNPVPYVGNVSGGLIPKGTLLAAGGVIPRMDGFEFDAYFTITSFTFTMSQAGDLISLTSNSSKFTSQMVTMLNKATKGQKVYIEDIKAKGPDGSSRSLSSIALKIG